MPEKLDLGFAVHLKPKDAIDHFRSKGYEISWNWFDVWQEAHARAFTVAKATKAEVLIAIRKELDHALEQGTTAREFAKTLEPRLKKMGWWGRKEVVDDDGVITNVQLGSPWRLNNIYRTNLQTAYMTGRYQRQIENAESRPYWQYIAVMDAQTRPAHAALHDRVFRFDDPIWDSHYPPNGWGCRCRVRTLTEKQIAAKKLTVESSEGKLRNFEVEFSEGRTADVTGFEVEPGNYFQPDTGWSYNPGKAGPEQLLRWTREKLETAEETIAINAIDELIHSDAFSRWLNKPEGSFPVARMKDDDAELIGALVRIVELSAETMAHHQREHPEITPQQYAEIQQTIREVERIQDGPDSFIYILQQADGYLAVVKATRTGKGLFLTSFRRLSKDQAKRDRELHRLRKKTNQ